MGVDLGSGTITSSPGSINCGTVCDETFAAGTTVTLTATPATGSVFIGWEGDISGSTNPATVTMNGDKSVRAIFELSATIPLITDFTPTGIQTYLSANTTVNTPARFLKALPPEFKRNWILMPRSESLQTGTAKYPRILLPSKNGQRVFTIGTALSSSYPGSHPLAIEYMQWDAADKNFRFHEIVLDNISAMGGFPARTRMISIDDTKCSKCHSTRNVLNTSPYRGTTGIPNGTVKVKNKPNWDTYDSWTGMLPFNRDRIYQGSIEAAAFRKIMNLWTWRTEPDVRQVIEQLELQPPGVGTADIITRTVGGPNDGHINFDFDVSPPVLIEPAPVGTVIPPPSTNYNFDNTASGTATNFQRSGDFMTLRHEDIPTQPQGEGRGVRLFDVLGGLAGGQPGNDYVNQKRVSDEIITHKWATGSYPIDVRPIALAIAKNGVLSVNSGTNTVQSNVTGKPLTIDLTFFNSRTGSTINGLITNTRERAESIPRRKADFQKVTLDRTGDEYLDSPTNGLIQEYGSNTSQGTTTALDRIRQEVFRRPIDFGSADNTNMGGIYVDRELYSVNTQKVALFRYFLEPLGVSVDQWSMGVRSRSMTYAFADIFDTYLDVFVSELTTSLTSDPVLDGLGSPLNPTINADLIDAVNQTLGTLPGAGDSPKFTDVQRIFNKACIECHGGLNYPPYSNYGTFLDLSEDESASGPGLDNRLQRSYDRASLFSSTILTRITMSSEDCPNGVMPCFGPALSNTDVETIRRWINGPPARPFTHGDPHIRTVNGVNYDFQNAGEYVLLRGQNFELQARHTAVETDGPLGPNAHTGLTTCVSLNTAVAVKVGGTRISLQPKLVGVPNPDGLDLRINGNIVQLSPAGISLGQDGRVIPTSAPGGIQIEGQGGSVVTITPGFWSRYQIWYLNIDTRNVRATEGLMGWVHPGNWLPALPNGDLLGPRPDSLQDRYDVLYNNFGQAWHVTNATSLFYYANGTSTETFDVPGWPKGNNPNDCKLPPQVQLVDFEGPGGVIDLQMAQDLCGNIIDPDRRANCIADVMATHEAGFAEIYLIADEIDQNVFPEAPRLGFPTDFDTVSLSELVFSWDKTPSEDGDSLSYRYLIWRTDSDVFPLYENAVLVDESAESPTRKGNQSLLIISLIALAIIAVLYFLLRNNKRLFAILAILVLGIAAAIYFYTNKGSEDVDPDKFLLKGIELAGNEKMEGGNSYFWKVIAEDTKGGKSESEIRRFTLK